MLLPLLKHVTVAIANEEDLQSALGLEVPDVDVRTGRLNASDYRHVIRRVCEMGPDLVAITLRRSTSASDNGWSALLGGKGYPLESQQYDIRIVDRVGAGDAFAAGLIYGLVSGRAPKTRFRVRRAAGAFKQTIPGDFNRVSVEEVDRLAAGDRQARPAVVVVRETS